MFSIKPKHGCMQFERKLVWLGTDTVKGLLTKDFPPPLGLDSPHLVIFRSKTVCCFNGYRPSMLVLSWTFLYLKTPGQSATRQPKSSAIAIAIIWSHSYGQHEYFKDIEQIEEN